MPRSDSAPVLIPGSGNYSASIDLRPFVADGRISIVGLTGGDSFNIYSIEASSAGGAGVPPFSRLIGTINGAVGQAYLVLQDEQLPRYVVVSHTSGPTLTATAIGSGDVGQLGPGGFNTVNRPADPSLMGGDKYVVMIAGATITVQSFAMAPAASILAGTDIDYAVLDLKQYDAFGVLVATRDTISTKLTGGIGVVAANVFYDWNTAPFSMSAGDQLVLEKTPMGAGQAFPVIGFRCGSF